MSHHDIVAIGASAGGIDALFFLAGSLPQDFPASILVTLHLPEGHRSELDKLLSRVGPMRAAFAADGEEIAPGRIYLAPPERHLLLFGRRLTLGVGPRENHARPAIDPMFRSVAICCGPRAIGVVLTGDMQDGASGLWALRGCGGIAVAQDPADAASPAMPRAAISHAQPQHVAPLKEIPPLIEKLARQPAGPPQPCPDRLRLEVEIARSGRATMNELDGVGRRSLFSCPDCGGVLWELDEGALGRYRCHEGHAYACEAMAVAYDERLRQALASALRALQERIALARRLEHQAAQHGRNLSAESWARKAEEFERQAATIEAAVREADEIAARWA